MKDCNNYLYLVTLSMEMANRNWIHYEPNLFLVDEEDEPKFILLTDAHKAAIRAIRKVSHFGVEFMVITMLTFFRCLIYNGSQQFLNY